MYFSTLWTTTSFITCMKAAKVFTLVRIFLEIPGWWYAVVNVVRDTQCRNYGKILSHIFFDKNFVKATFPYSFCKIVDLTKYLLFRLEKIYYFHTLWDQKATTATIYQKMHNVPIWALYGKMGFLLRDLEEE